MTSISQTIQNSSSKCALIPFITAGDPNLKITAEAIIALHKSGADVIELGLPYSVPLADGPTIQEASNRALIQNTTLDKVLKIVKNINQSVTIPIVLFTYYNPLISRGILQFIQDISRVGIQGLLIPDLPLEEADYINYLCHQFNIELIFLISPTSTTVRIKNIVDKANGSIYLVTKTGVTGTPSKLQPITKYLIDTIKTITYQPLILGFGISTPDQVKNLCNLNIEGIVLGSIFVKKLSNKTSTTGIKKIIEFCKELKQITFYSY
uniref:Tryptophan synthase alpha chain n=1 Tax=Hildenbrandia rubra TaxID=31481 RepID=A0A1C9CFZ3_9FLOR|nr:tryptophan synthase alpha subunit [Hildenbrandia rubra]AOM67303.1 tryptophan synthase alpha subunit [Hildenbrandia rubra]